MVAMLRWALGLVVVVLAGMVLGVAGCGDGGGSAQGGEGGGSSGVGSGGVPAEQRVDLLFTYGSEKESWIRETTAAFNGAKVKTKGGKVIVVDARPMGSGECIDEILSGRTKAHLTSPASGVFIKLGNARSRAERNQDLVGPTENLVLSPVVIAMWRPMAEALGWPEKPVGWAEILSLVRDQRGWGAVGHPEWGKFKFGHTHPEYSNSGLIAVLAEVYAGAGKTSKLSLSDVQKPETGAFLGAIEQAVVHYGSSTGFFGKRMFAGGPTYLSAAVLYENMVIESYKGGKGSGAFPVVAIYPKEGTFWSDHPVGVVQREWVTAEHAEAAKVYRDYLLAAPQQERALAHGFRPADMNVQVGEPISLANGVNPKEPQNVLEVPEADVVAAALELWRKHKKHANVVLVFDTSGSMAEGGKMENAREGAEELIKLLGDEDTLSLLPFSTQYTWAGQGLVMRKQREQALRTVRTLIPTGNTRLYESVLAAYRYLESNPQPTRISAIVVLTDGADTASTVKLHQLLPQIKSDNEKRPIRVFTIGYGGDARKDELQKMAEETQGRFSEGKPENIRQVFKDIATFF